MRYFFQILSGSINNVFKGNTERYVILMIISVLYIFNDFQLFYVNIAVIPQTGFFISFCLFRCVVHLFFVVVFLIKHERNI